MSLLFIFQVVTSGETGLNLSINSKWKVYGEHTSSELR